VLPGERTSIMTEPFPEVRPDWHNPEAVSAAELFMGIVSGIRNIRSELMLHPSAETKVIVICHDPARIRQLESVADSIKGLTRTQSLSVMLEGERPKGAATFIYTDIEIFVPMAGLVDIEAETQKLRKEQDKVEADLKRTRGKLANEKFMANAPEEVVNKETEKAVELEAKLAKIEQNMARLAELA
jgi:valyl-tRNA synthetase